MTQAQAAARRKPMGRGLKIALGIAGALAALLAIALIVLLTYDWNKARPWLNAKVSEAIERPFEINGNLSLSWELPARNISHDKSWRDYIPWPHLVAQSVRVGNPAGISGPDMARVRQFSFSLNPLALLDKRINIPVLRFASPVVELQRQKDGLNNWTFRKKTEEAKWELDLERVVLTKGVVHLRDAVLDIDATADVDTLDNDERYGVSWKLRGSYNDAPVRGSGKAGAVLSLKQQSTPYPVQADVKLGSNTIAVEGTVTKPAKLAALDLRLRLAGPSMARLYPYTGVLLPETPAFRTEGRLLGAIDERSQHWTYDKFTGKVGSSDIAGRLEFRTGAPRPRLSGTVESKLLNFADLGPLIGADSNASKKQRGVEAVQPAGKVLPVETFRTERWTALDADVRFSAERIVRKKALPIRKLSTHLVLKNGVLTLEPLTFAIAGGTLKSTIRMDGSGRAGKDAGVAAIRATAKVAARGIKIRELFPSIDKLQATVGTINGDASLSAKGNSVATLLGGSNGEVKAVISQGTISKLLLEQMGLNVGNIIVTKLFGDKQVQLNCMASDFAVTNGLAQTRVFVVDTEEATINVGGTVNLANEQMNFTIRPETKGLRIFSLRTPLYVRGSFSQPDVDIDKGVLALKAGGAIALGLAAPVAALLPLIHAGPGEDSPCGRLLAQARQKPVAPPPGKTLKR